MTEVLNTPVSQWALEAARNARLTLEAGVTFVRDLAGADRGIRDALAAGFVAGPALQISVVLICQTGGHGDAYLRGAGLESMLTPDFPGRPPYRRRRRGRDAARRARDAAGGRRLDQARHDRRPRVRPRPAARRRLHPRGDRSRGVRGGSQGQAASSAHAYGGTGLTNAVEAGARSIEHGGFLTEEQAALMAERGCLLVPTLSAMRDCLRWAEEGALTPTQCKKILEFGLELGECVRIAKEYGVPLASGTDYIKREQHGMNLEETALMHAAGLTVEETLLAATPAAPSCAASPTTYGRIAAGLRVRRDRARRRSGRPLVLRTSRAPSPVCSRRARPPCRTRVSRGCGSVTKPHVELRGISQALRRRAGARRRRAGDRARLDPRARGRERRRQVDAREDPRGCPPAGRRRAARRRPPRRLPLAARRARRRAHDHRAGADARPAPLGRRRTSSSASSAARRRRRPPRHRAAVRRARRAGRHRAAGRRARRDRSASPTSRRSRSCARSRATRSSS